VGKILVIDDDEAFRSSVMATLKMQGFDVLEAASGAVGVQMARNSPSRPGSM
jgi:DNA-binding response OmpR family regulator